MTAKTTVIKASWIIGFQGDGHRLLRDGVVVYESDRIVHVGPTWNGPTHEVIDARGKLVTPGFISTHCHISSQAGARLLVDGGRREFLRSSFLNTQPSKLAGGPSFSAKEDKAAAIRWAFATMVRNGVTTVVEGGGLSEGDLLVELAAEAGLRVYYSPTYDGADYFFDERGRLVRKWNEAGGFAGLDRAIEFIRRFDHANDGRFSGILIPNEFYTATPELLKRTKAAAKELGVGITLHVSEQLFEFHETVRTTGTTPVRVLADMGFLGPEVIIGHCMYVDGHRMTAFPYRGDLEAVAKAGSSVAHSPVPFSRRGVMLENFDRYREAGINMSIGTDTYPNDIIEEMRMASVSCKFATGNNEAGKAADVFEAATLGGARALGRTDIGRLEPGAQADIVVVDLDNPRVGPVRDPLHALIHSANGELVDRVIVAGRTLVMDGRLLLVDAAKIQRDICASTEAVWKAFPEANWAGRSVDEAFPPALKTWDLGPTEPVHRAL